MSKNVMLLLCMSLVFIISSCKKDDDGDSTSGSTAEYYFAGDFGSESILLEVGNGLSTEGSSSGPCGDWYELSGGIWVSATRAEVLIGLNGDDTVGWPSPSSKYESYSVGAKQYQDCANGLSEGVVIRYVDASGATWSSNGGAQESTATFEITEREEWDGMTFAQSVKVKEAFSCKLYNEDGASKDFTNGEFSSQFTF